MNNATTGSISYPSSLVAYWNFDNDDFTDASSNGNDGTIYGATYVDGDTGKGRAINFDGLNDYATATLNGLPASTSDITMSFWAYSDTSGGDAVFAASPDDSTNRLLSHLVYSNGNTYWDMGNIS